MSAFSGSECSIRRARRFARSHCAPIGRSRQFALRSGWNRMLLVCAKCFEQTARCSHFPSSESGCGSLALCLMCLEIIVDVQCFVCESEEGSAGERSGCGSKHFLSTRRKTGQCCPLWRTLLTFWSKLKSKCPIFRSHRNEILWYMARNKAQENSCL